MKIFKENYIYFVLLVQKTQKVMQKTSFCDTDNHFDAINVAAS